MRFTLSFSNTDQFMANYVISFFFLGFWFQFVVNWTFSFSLFYCYIIGCSAFLIKISECSVYFVLYFRIYFFFHDSTIMNNSIYKLDKLWNSLVYQADNGILTNLHIYMSDIKGKLLFQASNWKRRRKIWTWFEKARKVLLWKNYTTAILMNVNKTDELTNKIIPKWRNSFRHWRNYGRAYSWDTNAQLTDSPWL